MGFPATALLANNGRHDSYPFYVWLADVPDGPLWRLMDQEFDLWDERTGRHLAFFVDPFQKPEWARKFLGMLDFDRGLTREVLQAGRAAQEFYRDRLSMNLARHFRIGREFLPAAIVATNWDAPSAVVAFLRGAAELQSLFDYLILLDRSERDGRDSSPPAQRAPRGAHSFQRTRWLAQQLGDQFDVQIYEFPKPFATAVHTAFEPTSVHYFVEHLRKSGEDSPWLLGTGRYEAAQGFGLSKAYVALTSLDDILAVASEIGELTGRIVERYRGDPDVEQLRLRLQQLTELKKRIDDLSDHVQRAIERDDEAAAVDAFGPFEAYAREFDLVKHLITVLGARTFGALAPESRDAVAASELIYLLSLKINDLRRDLTGAMVGYWKASEREGRRVFHELIRRHFEVAFSVPHSPQQEATQVRASDVDRFTLGSLRKVFRGLVVLPREHAPQLPAHELGRLLTTVTFDERNPFSHFKMLTPAELEAARNRMGCKNPVGVLPLFVSCLEAIDPSLVPDENGTHEARELEFLRQDVFPQERNTPSTQQNNSPEPRRPSRASPPPPARRTEPPTASRKRKRTGISIGTVGEWVATDQRTKKKKIKFRQRDGDAYGILHPTSKVPENIEDEKIYQMRVASGGDLYQLEWIPDEV